MILSKNKWMKVGYLSALNQPGGGKKIHVSKPSFEEAHSSDVREKPQTQMFYTENSAGIKHH